MYPLFNYCHINSKLQIPWINVSDVIYISLNLNTRSVNPQKYDTSEKCRLLDLQLIR